MKNSRQTATVDIRMVMNHSRQSNIVKQEKEPGKVAGQFRRCRRGLRRCLSYSWPFLLVIILREAVVPSDRGSADKFLNQYLHECSLQTTAAASSAESSHCPCLPSGAMTSSRRLFESISPLSNDSVNWSMPASVRSSISVGGHWKPSRCTARHHVAVIIPYRDREHHLRIFLQYIHQFLQIQLVHYQIFVVEQTAPEVFNRAALQNVGFIEAEKTGEFDCFIFHDVDLLPEDLRMMYSCVFAPLHLGAFMNKFGYTTPGATFFGGAVAISGAQMKSINGFSNQFYGWGGEDDEAFVRVDEVGLLVKRYPLQIGKTSMFLHARDVNNSENSRKHSAKFRTRDEHLRDGLNSSSYEVESQLSHQLYTHVKVQIFPEKQDVCRDESGEYLNCITDENIVSGKLDCCKDNGQVFCCDKYFLLYRVFSWYRRSKSFQNRLWKITIGLLSILMIVLALRTVVSRLTRAPAAPYRETNCISSLRCC